MLVSLRSNLIAGTAAIVGAGAVAATPVEMPMPAVGNAVSEVALTAFVNPFAELFASAEQFQNYLLNGSYSVFGAENWPGAGINDLMNDLLTQEVDLGLYSSVGLLPQLITNAGPISQQLQVNWLDYLNVGLSGGIAAATAIGNGIWDYPAALVDAFELAVGGDIGAAFTVLVDAVVAPITAATEAVFNAGGYILGGIVARLAAVIETIPRNVASFIEASVGAVALTAETSAALATEWFADLAAGDFEAAWNTAWSGLLGPTGLPGLAWNMSTGAGVQTGPITDPADVADNFVPSFRTAVQSTIWAVAEALATNPVAAETVAAPAQSAESAELAPSAESVEAVRSGAAAESDAASAVEAGESDAAPAVEAGESAAVEAPAASADSAVAVSAARSESAGSSTRETRTPAAAEGGADPAATGDGPRTRRAEGGPRSARQSVARSGD